MRLRTAFLLFMTLTACTSLSPAPPEAQIKDNTELRMTKAQLFGTIKKAYELGYKDGAEDACKAQKNSI